MPALFVGKYKEWRIDSANEFMVYEELFSRKQ